MRIIIKSDITQFQDGELDRLLNAYKDHIIEHRTKGKFIYLVILLDIM